jgi:ferric-dicitrate binding protein FerR (iron transport regulator)
MVVFLGILGGFRSVQYWKAQAKMQRYFGKYITAVALVLITILTLMGCTATSTEQPANDHPRADLTAVESTAELFRSGGNSGTEVKEDQTVNVETNDRIELDKGSRSILKFPNILEAELFRNAIILLTDIRQETGGSTDVALDLKQGHMFVRLNDTTISQVTVETPYSTVKTLQDGTEFDVCHNETLTCVWVKRGTVEVIGQGEKQILNAGEASYILKDQPPSPAICAPIETFTAWEENYRKSADTPALGQVVSQLQQEPCTVPVTGDQIQADLTAVESTTKVFKGGSTETDIQQDQTVNVQVADRIELDQGSRSILKFPDVLEAELFRNAIVLLTDVKQESGGSTDVNLNLTQGHMFMRLNASAISQVTVETMFATIKTVEDGTEFDICHNEKLTCVLVKKGIVEIVAQGKKETVEAGEASYILKDQPPSSAICAPVEIFADWEESYRKSADTPALGKMVSQLPQEPCTTQNVELPLDAHILYKDDFKNISSGWPQAKIDNYSVGYSAGEYYRIEILNPNFKNPVYIPNKTKYEDVNIDLKVSTETAKDGDFHYGLVFRRSGDQYYAFTISPRTKKWYVLKSSTDAFKTLKEGAADNIQGLKGADTLRVSAKGSLFFFRINGRLVYQINDPDYANGEVGLFVQTRDSSDALIRFDTITIWDIQAPFIDPTPGAREICFNNKDDDGDKLIDKADPDCKISNVSPTPTSFSPVINTPPTLPPTSTDVPATSTDEPPTSTDEPPPPTDEPPTEPPPPTNPPPPTEPPPPTDPPLPTDPPVIP